MSMLLVLLLLTATGTVLGTGTVVPTEHILNDGDGDEDVNLKSLTDS